MTLVMPGPEVTRHTPAFPGRLGISFRHMARALFMACQDHFNIFLLVKRIENLQHDTAGKRKDRLHAFPLQTFDEDFSTGEFHGNPPSNRKHKVDCR